PDCRASLLRRAVSRGDRRGSGHLAGHRQASLDCRQGLAHAGAFGLAPVATDSARGPGDWQRINELFHAAVALPPGERTAFLDSACADVPAMREEVLSLLAPHERAERFLEPNADGTTVMARVLHEEAT